MDLSGAAWISLQIVVLSSILKDMILFRFCICVGKGLQETARKIIWKKLCSSYFLKKDLIATTYPHNN